MRSYLMLVVLCAVCFETTVSAAHSSRQYLDVKTCEVQPGKIVVTTASQIYEVKRLRTDTKGAYICPSDLILTRALESSSAAGPNEIVR